MKNYDLYIFDLDGTIINSGEAIIESIVYMLKTLNYSIPSQDKLMDIIGPPLSYTFDNQLHIKNEDYDRARVLYRSYFEKQAFGLLKVYKGIRNLFAGLKANGAKLAIATSKPIEPSMKILKYFKLDKFFDKICAPKIDGTNQTKADIVAEALELEHNHAVMIGDRIYDANGAKCNNIDFIAAMYGFSKGKEEFEGFEPILFADKVSDIIEYFNLKLPLGKFVSIEGMDGCGKTTQVNKLIDSLNKFGFDMTFTREPGGTKISEDIRKIILSNDNIEMHPITEAYLYAASRAQHVQELIIPSLQSGKHVLCDRYVDSSIAYQGGGRDLGLDEVANLNSMAIGDYLPDKTIYMSMDAQKAINRRRASSQADRLEQEKIDFFVKTKEVFDKLIEKDNKRFVLIDADRDIDSIAKDIFINVVKVLEKNTDWDEK